MLVGKTDESVSIFMCTLVAWEGLPSIGGQGMVLKSSCVLLQKGFRWLDCQATYDRRLFVLSVSCLLVCLLVNELEAFKTAGGVLYRCLLDGDVTGGGSSGPTPTFFSWRAVVCNRRCCCVDERDIPHLIVDD